MTRLQLQRRAQHFSVHSGLSTHLMLPCSGKAGSSFVPQA